MITKINITSQYLTSYTYKEEHGENVSIALSEETETMLRWVREKMDNENRIRELAKSHPAVADAVEALHTANEQLKLVVALVK